ncbi:MAG: alpha/beta hydrolase [Caulobacteraceae bacterium]|nr:alpha/beta hydrolase [Caulobacteraceae bacterium]
MADWRAVRDQLEFFRDPALADEAERRVTAEAASRAETRSIAGPAGELAVRVVRPKGEVRGAYLHTHGGAWCLGRPSMFDNRLGWMAEAGLVVASVDYRLAPEHPYPAACDDCEAAALWWVETARQEFGAEQVLVGGESAGGHLAAVTTLRLRRRHGYKFAGVNLEFGLYDFSNGLPSRRVVDGRPFQDSVACDAYADAFAPDATRRRDPDLSPLYADLSDLPPALLTVGMLDSFRDDSLLLYERWRIAGNTAFLVTYEGAPHGFELIACEETRFQHRVPVSFAERRLSGELDGSA